MQRLSCPYKILLYKGNESSTIPRYLSFHFVIKKLFVEPSQSTVSTVVVQVQHIQNVSAATTTCIG